MGACTVGVDFGTLSGRAVVVRVADGTELGSGVHSYRRGVIDSSLPSGERLDASYDPHEPYDRTPLDMLLDKERWNHLNDILSDFSDKDRQFLDLFYARGLEAEAVAAEMNISLKTVYSKNHKIRNHLRRCLERLTEVSAIADMVPATA